MAKRSSEVSSEASSEEEAKEAFALLQPKCTEVMRAPSLSTLQSLDITLHGITSLHPRLVDYVVLPLRMIIRRTGSSNMELLEAALKSLAIVFERVQGLISWNLFEEIFTFCCLLLDDKMASQTGYASRSEDLILIVVRTLKLLLLSLDKSLRETLFSHLPMVGHCVSVLLETAQQHQFKTLRATALGALLALSGVCDGSLVELVDSIGSSVKDEDFSLHLRAVVDHVGSDVCNGEGKRVFASFLPGIAMCLSKLVTTDANLGKATVLLALLTWAHYVTLVMAESSTDSHEEETSRAHLPTHATDDAASPESRQPQIVERTKSWREDTDKKLSILIHKMSFLVSHENWKVRIAMVTWCHALLSHCLGSLPVCLPAILEVLVTLSHDSYPQVARAASDSMIILSQRFTAEGHGALTALLEERLHSLASALPRLMRQHDDSRKLSTLQLLAGYLKLLGPHTISLVHSHPHLSRITQALIQTFKLEVGNIQIMEQSAHFVSMETDALPLKLQYQHFRSEEVETLLQQVCQLLGFYGSLPVLLDHLLDVFQGYSLHRKEVTLIIIHVLKGFSGQGCVQRCGKPPHTVSNEHLHSLMELLIEELISPGVWNSDLDHFSPTSSPSSLSSPHESALLSSLLLNAVAVCAIVLGRDFERLIQRVVYPLVQKLANPNSSVSSYAVTTLRTVCQQCGYSSLPQLISRNSDYLVNSVALQLRGGASHHPEALQVMQAVLMHGSADIFALMRDSTTELLLSLDLKEDPAFIWPTLHTLATAAAKWAPLEVPPSAATQAKSSSGTAIEEETESTRSTLTSEELRDFFLDYHRKKEHERWTEPEGESSLEEDKETPGQKKLTPIHLAASDVLQRCTHHLSVPSVFLRLTVLETLKQCLIALKDDHATLLPLAHKVWPAFLPRLSDSTPFVTLSAVEVVRVMCDVCGSFLRKRVVKFVWPPMIKSLETLSKRSHSSDKAYSQTADFKLQRKLLQCVGELCEKLDMSPSDMEPMAHACLPYLSAEQPRMLQEASKTSLGYLAQRDPDGIWLLLAQLQSTDTTRPPHPLLIPYKFRSFSDSAKYMENVNELLLLTCDST